MSCVDLLFHVLLSVLNKPCVPITLCVWALTPFPTFPYIVVSTVTHTSSLCTSNPLREFPNLLSLFLYLSVAPVSSYLALINYICLGMVIWLVLYGSLTWLIQLVYLIHIHDLSTKSMWNVPYLACLVVVWPWIALLCTSLWIKDSAK